MASVCPLIAMFFSQSVNGQLLEILGTSECIFSIGYMWFKICSVACLKFLILHHRHYDTLATGIIYFHRFYMFHSFKQFPRYVSIYHIDYLMP